MSDYFERSLAWQPNVGPTPNVEADVYAISDTGFTSPLDLTDMSDVPIAKLVADSFGVYPQFKVVTGETAVVTKSGSIISALISELGKQGDPGLSVVDANVVDGELIFTMSDASEINAGAVEGFLPATGGQPEGYVLTVVDGDPVWAASTGGGGRQVEIGTNATHIIWRYTGDTVWQNLIAKSELAGTNGTNGANGTNGTNGESIQMRQNGDYIQAKYPSQTAWNNVALYPPPGGVMIVHWNGTAWPDDRPTARTDITVLWVGGPPANIPPAATGTDIHMPDKP